jgi:hypothetical protein
VVNDQSIELQILHKRKKNNSAYRLYKFVDPAKSRFLIEKIKNVNNSNANENELILDSRRSKELKQRENK